MSQHGFNIGIILSKYIAFFHKTVLPNLVTCCFYVYVCHIAFNIVTFYFEFPWFLLVSTTNVFYHCFRIKCPDDCRTDMKQSVGKLVSWVFSSFWNLLWKHSGLPTYCIRLQYVHKKTVLNCLPIWRNEFLNIRIIGMLIFYQKHLLKLITRLKFDAVVLLWQDPIELKFPQ